MPAVPLCVTPAPLFWLGEGQYWQSRLWFMTQRRVTPPGSGVVPGVGRVGFWWFRVEP